MSDRWAAEELAEAQGSADHDRLISQARRDLANAIDRQGRADTDAAWLQDQRDIEGALERLEALGCERADELGGARATVDQLPREGWAW